MRWTSFESNPYGQLFERKNNKGYDRVVIQLPEHEAKELFVFLFKASHSDFEVGKSSVDEVYDVEGISVQEWQTFSESMGYVKNHMKLKDLENKTVWKVRGVYEELRYRIIHGKELVGEVV